MNLQNKKVLASETSKTKSVYNITFSNIGYKIFNHD